MHRTFRIRQILTTTSRSRNDEKSMKHAHDDIRVGVARLPFLKEMNGWLMPWGEVVRNPLKAQRLAEELDMKRGAQ